jgi:acetylornithine deacetylase/succinyl-diaminopimelate desuccinylase-like protein
MIINIYSITVARVVKFIITIDDMQMEGDQMTTYAFEEQLDEEYLIKTLVELLQADCSVDLGPDTMMDPDHPKLVHYVQEVIRPRLTEMGIYDVVDLPKNQIGVQLGSGDGDTNLLIMAYTPVQHYNWMDDPFSGKIAIPDNSDIDEPCAWGQGASQNKAHFAAILTMLKAFAEADIELNGTLHFVANNEGFSSHECSRAAIPKLDPRPDFGIVLLGGENDVIIGNRGRVDVVVHVYGEATHSSTPDKGLNAIIGVNKVINRINDMDFTKTHSELGDQHAVPYQVTYDPVAPHTLPANGHIRIDRRLLPGDDIDEAVNEVRDAIGDLSPFEVEVDRGVAMEPSVVESDSPIVQELQSAIESLDGEQADEVYWSGAYDAGGPTNMGIPTVMWGRPEYNQSLLGDDYVTLRGVKEEAQILGRLTMNMLSESEPGSSQT